MSHISNVKIAIKSLQALETAAGRLGCVFRHNQRTFQMWNRKAPCDHAIALCNARSGNYEVGVVRQGREFELQIDNFDHSLTAVVGRDCTALAREYAVAVAEQETADLVAQGWQINRVNLPSGEVQLTLTDGQD